MVLQISILSVLLLTGCDAISIQKERSQAATQSQDQVATKPLNTPTPPPVTPPEENNNGSTPAPSPSPNPSPNNQPSQPNQPTANVSWDGSSQLRTAKWEISVVE